MYVDTTQIRNNWGLLREQCAESREGTSAVLLQSGLDEKWWAEFLIPWNAAAMRKETKYLWDMEVYEYFTEAEALV